MSTSLPFTTQRDPAALRRPPADAAVWRYMDMATFMAFVEQRSLFFGSACKLNDRNEGRSGRDTVRAVHGALRQLSEPGLASGPREDLLPGAAGLAETVRECLTEISRGDALRDIVSRFVYLNSWHMASLENIVMWQACHPTGFAVCVKSTFARLEETLRNNRERYPTLCFEVQYTDDEAGEADNYLLHFARKPPQFAAEAEVRALVDLFEGVCLSGERRDLLLQLIKQGGVSMPVDVYALVDEVVLHPFAPSWFTSVVETYVRRVMGRDVPVTRSSVRVHKA
ncbi:MAG TPA: hypothetical protein VFH51_14465 [Myxococcota bacterium]|nr:hypothetical protein [Myxococcota bacterium]